MHRASSYALGFFLLTVISLHATAALSAVSDGNSTENGTVADGGFVPLVFSKVNQIIAREGNCALIDCNVTGDPDPSVQWFNSHGDLLDTETSGKWLLTDDGILNITDIRFADRGKYTCMASNVHGSANCTVTMRVVLHNGDLGAYYVVVYIVIIIVIMTHRGDWIMHNFLHARCLTILPLWSPLCFLVCNTPPLLPILFFECLSFEWVSNPNPLPYML
uniref:Microfibril associated protein 3 like n=1 Tax=Oncorhynchus mykiss TaxID=8022 RepID=A0A8C7STA2_ONCMY